MRLCHVPAPPTAAGAPRAGAPVPPQWPPLPRRAPGVGKGRGGRVSPGGHTLGLAQVCAQVGGSGDSCGLFRSPLELPQDGPSGWRTTRSTLGLPDPPTPEKRAFSPVSEFPIRAFETESGESPAPGFLSPFEEINSGERQHVRWNGDSRFIYETRWSTELRAGTQLVCGPDHQDLGVSCW